MHVVTALARILAVLGYMSVPIVGYIFATNSPIQLPYIGMKLPYYDSPTALRPPASVAFNVFLMVAFGASHSLLARRSVHVWVINRSPIQIPEDAMIPLYTFVSGVSFLLVGFLWIPHADVYLWRLPLPEALDQHRIAVSWAMFVPAVLGFVLSMLQLGSVFTSFGMKRLNEDDCDAPVSKYDKKKKLVTSGVYGIVRHPLYCFMVFLCLGGTEVTLDRGTLALGIVLYLYSFGLPIEEAKLVDEFGEGYELYREKVPAILPAVETIVRRAVAVILPTNTKTA